MLDADLLGLLGFDGGRCVYEGLGGGGAVLFNSTLLVVCVWCVVPNTFQAKVKFGLVWSGLLNSHP